MQNQFFEEEREKYRKRKPSSKSKAKAKTNHKHTYEDCLLLKKGHPHKAMYCSICGKISNAQFLVVEEYNCGYRALSDTEILEKYKNLVRFEVDCIFQKYVELS